MWREPISSHRGAGDEDQRKVVRRPGLITALRSIWACASAEVPGTISCCSDALSKVSCTPSVHSSKASPAKGGNAVVDVKVGILAVCRQARVQRVVDGGVFLAFFGLATRNHAVEDGVVA